MMGLPINTLSQLAAWCRGNNLEEVQQKAGHGHGHGRVHIPHYFSTINVLGTIITSDTYNQQNQATH